MSGDGVFHMGRNDDTAYLEALSKQTGVPVSALQESEARQREHAQKRFDEIKLQRAASSPDNAADSEFAAWSEDDLDELCSISETDIESAVQAASPKLRDLNTAQVEDAA